MSELPDINPHVHRLKLALLQPQIAPNTGNIARLCVATGTALHLVRPMGFVLSDRQLKRSAMDYWPRLRLTIHDDDASFFRATGSERFWLFSSRGHNSVWETKFRPGDWLIFGSETRGISDEIIERYPNQLVRIPQVPGARCLNLSSAAAVALYEAIRQVSLPVH